MLHVFSVIIKIKKKRVVVDKTGDYLDSVLICLFIRVISTPGVGSKTFSCFLGEDILVLR